MEATSLASGARKKGNAVEQLRERPPLNMLPARLATHRAARKLLVNDDAVTRIALARLDDQHPLAVAEGSGCGANPDVSGIATVSLFARGLRPVRVAGGSALGSEWVDFRPVLGECQLPPSCVSTSA